MQKVCFCIVKDYVLSCKSISFAKVLAVNNIIHVKNVTY